MKSFAAIKHKETPMILSDMSNTTPAQAMEAASGLLKSLSKLLPKSALLLIDLTDCHFDNKSVESWMQVAPQVQPYVKAMAIVTTDRFLKIIVSNVTTNANLPFLSFATRQEAMDWLASKA
jgi:hypothetical protein